MIPYEIRKPTPPQKPKANFISMSEHKECVAVIAIIAAVAGFVAGVATTIAIIAWG